MILKPIPTHVITGFLGVGKTSLIKYLLSNKPADETWAVLVNEFGEIGIDGELLKGSDTGIAIKEVAGGCLCCAAGVPTQVAVNQLIARAKPDRLLIEPTGLGHPKEIVEVLSQGHFQQVIALKSTICLVDPRKLQDDRYLQSSLFIDQLRIADLILATKMDLSDEADLTRLQGFLTQQGITAIPVPVSLMQTPKVGEQSLFVFICSHYFDRATAWHTQPAIKAPANAMMRPALPFEEAPETEIAFDEQGIYRASNQHEGNYSAGWVFDCRFEFDFEGLIAWVKGLECLRFKAVVITDEGIAALNLVDGQLTVMELDDSLDSRLELIASTAINVSDIEAALLQLSKPLAI